VRFEGALEKGDGFVLMRVNVSPGAKNSGIVGYNEWRRAIEVRVKSPAKDGRANREMIEKLEELFNARIGIVKGDRSNLKTLRIDASYGEVVKVLQPLLGR
jgi:hypothetical protein